MGPNADPSRVRRLLASAVSSLFLWRRGASTDAGDVGADAPGNVNGLFGERGEPLRPPPWGLQLSHEPPIFLLRGLVSPAEAEAIIAEYDVELLPSFEYHTNESSPWAFQRCTDKFARERCARRTDQFNHCDFQEAPALFKSSTMSTVDKRIADIVGVPEDHLESAWLFNWAKRSQGLHLDNYHHYMHPRRIATLLVRLRPDPVGVVFPLARLRDVHSTVGDESADVSTPSATHAVAEDEELVSMLSELARELPFRGSGAGRHVGDGAVKKAFLEICSGGGDGLQLRLEQGDALLYYHLNHAGQVDVRAMHASCPIGGDADDIVPGKAVRPRPQKLFMARFVRGASLLKAHGSRQTPHLLHDLRAWMDEQSQESGFDAGAVLLLPSGDVEFLGGHTCADDVSAGTNGGFWLIRVATANGQSESLCSLPGGREGDAEAFTWRQPGERFSVQIAVANVGQRPWPEGVMLTVRDGDSMGGQVLRIPNEVEVGTLFMLSLDLIAPMAGAAHGVWTLSDLDRRPFGPLFWVDAITSRI
eukprot:TRINITY_DN20090_c0_g1_i1.p1 TRINITY_DN20090_c0_g1~~TRINITY_DN20090_c0_g1_i1.p1  ORF type:complete len:533 (-),score=94.24 TRINITY_DN20090_c0_g1_i1:39-1637(-)